MYKNPEDVGWCFGVAECHNAAHLGEQDLRWHSD